MRLTPDQTRAIRQGIQRHMGEHARIWLFGSRVNDSRRGGDVDLYVEPETAPDLTARLALEKTPGLPVDIVVLQRGAPGSAFARMARSRADRSGGV